MPELPDVEVFKRYVSATALRQPIEKAEVRAPARMLKASKVALERRLKGSRLEKARRHGKYLFARMRGDGWLVLHFGMTGFVQYFKDGDPPDHTHLLIRFRNGYRLAYAAPRQIGHIDLADDLKDFVEEKGLGPDAYGLTERQFRELGKSGRGGIKAWLTRQEVVAGVGNVYADEILFHARVDPRAPREQLDARTWRRLYKSLREVLRKSIRAKADPEKMPSSFLLPHRDKGEKCPRCGTRLKNISVSGRTTWLCPKCQKKP